MMKKSIQKCAIIAVLAAGLYIQNAWASTIPTGISVDGMDFSGKTTEEDMRGHTVSRFFAY